jgi:hypothetical protein
MASKQKVVAPDGREWEVRSYRFRWPGFVGFRSSPDPASPYSSYTPSALIARLVLAISFSLVLFIVMSILKALVTPFRRRAWVDALSHKPDQKRLSWKTTRAHVRVVAQEVSEQIASGNPPEPQNAEPVK